MAELGDVNGDRIGDYAVGLPSANSDAGVVYVFLGQNGTPLPSTPTALDLANASFHINGHAGEMLGYTVVGNDVNDDGLADIAIGAPMAGAPGKSGGGAVYVVFGSAHPTDVATTTLSGLLSSTDPVPARDLDGGQPLRRLPAELAHGHGARCAPRRQRRRLRRSRRGRA